MSGRGRFPHPGTITPWPGLSGPDGPRQINLLVRFHTQARSHLRNVTWPPLFPCIPVPCKGFRPEATSVVCRTSRLGPFPFALPSKRGDFAAYTCCDLNCVAKFPLLSGEVALIGYPEARVSRVTGKFDTTASRPKWQVGFLLLPGKESTNRSGSCGKSSKNAKAPLPRGVAPRHLHWSLASRNNLGGSCPPSAFARPVSASWLWLLPGSAFSWPPNLPGSLLHHWRPTHSNQGAV